MSGSHSLSQSLNQSEKILSALREKRATAHSVQYSGENLDPLPSQARQQGRFDSLHLSFTWGGALQAAGCQIRLSMRRSFWQLLLIAGFNWMARSAMRSKPAATVSICCLVFGSATALLRLRTRSACPSQSWALYRVDCMSIVTRDWNQPFRHIPIQI